MLAGNIPHHTPKEEVDKFFSRYGEITRLDWKTGFCFIEYDNHKDSAYVVEKLNGAAWSDWTFLEFHREMGCAVR